MRICQVTPGLLPIPPNGWGAVEKIIWEYHLQALDAGHESEIRYLNDVDDSFDIVHIHVANLALEASARGIPYVFTLHDHHVYVHGENSFLYQQNLEAIKRSIITFVPAKFLIPYFGNHPNLIYLEHGVNTDYFKPGIIPSANFLLCVANNGFADNQGFDRKGFSYAIQAAKNLNLPITIAGASNNKNFFESYRQTYKKLTVLFDLTEEELLRTYQTHSIFLHPSILEAGHPNLTLLEAMACGLPVVGTYEANNTLPGLYRTERDIGQIMKGIQYTIDNYDIQYDLARDTANKYSYKNITNKLFAYYMKINKNEQKMKEQLLKIYNETPITIRQSKYVDDKIIITFINGAKVEIVGENNAEYYVQFIDPRTNKVDYETILKTNRWAKTSKEYFVPWVINIFKRGELIHRHVYDATKKRVYISFDSKSIGDTLAWFPYVEEFRLKHNCEVIVSTYHNEWFEDTYPELKFVKPGMMVKDLYAMYSVGWYYNHNETDFNKIPIKFIEHPLQESATAILGLDYSEIKPIIPVEYNLVRNISPKKRYVVIAPHASAHAKYWNYPGGWQTVIDHIKSIGYDVIMLTQEALGDEWHDSKLGGTLTGVIDKTGNLPMMDRFKDIADAELFIGLGSGLSWVAWALDVKTIVISGFSEPYTEFSSGIRLFNNDPLVCSGCFNRHRLDAGDWEWCPDHKNTDRQFECTKTITPATVIEAVDSYLSIL